MKTLQEIKLDELKAMCEEDIARQEREQKEAKKTVRLETYEGQLFEENVWSLEYYPNRTKEDEKEIGGKFYDNKIKDFYIQCLGDGGDPLAEQTIYWKAMFADSFGKSPNKEVFIKKGTRLNEPTFCKSDNNSKNDFFLMYYRGGEKVLVAKKFMNYLSHYYIQKQYEVENDIQEYFFGKEEEQDDRERTK